MNHNTRFKSAAALFAAAVLSISAVPAAAAGGGGGGGGSASPPPVLSYSASVDSFTSLPMIFGVRATSSTSDLPVITINSAPAGMILLAQGSFTNIRGFLPYSYITVQWTPGRDQIGVQSMSFTATSRSGSTTSSAIFTVHDAPSPITGLVAIASADQRIAASWDPTVGGVSPVSHSVTACYILPAPPAVIITRSTPRATSVCELVDTTAANQSAFSSMSQPSVVTGLSYPYYAVSVFAVGADGVGTIGGYAAVTQAP